MHYPKSQASHSENFEKSQEFFVMHCKDFMQ